MPVLLADFAASAELGGLMALAFALVKVLEKGYEAQRAKSDRANGKDPWSSLSATVERLVLAVADLKAHVELQKDVLGRAERRDERMELLLVKLEARQAAPSDQGKVVA